MQGFLFNTGPFKYCASLSIYVSDFYFSSFSFLTNFDLDLLLPFLLADTPLSLLCKLVSQLLDLVFLLCKSRVHAEM